MDIYIARHNADLTEGRGPSVIHGYFENAEDAVKSVENDFKVMGIEPSGTVYSATLFETFEEHTRFRDAQRLAPGLSPLEFQIWGYRQGSAGQWGHGWVDLREDRALLRDPEFRDYLRLKKKFEQGKAR